MKAHTGVAHWRFRGYEATCCKLEVMRSIPLRFTCVPCIAAGVGHLGLQWQLEWIPRLRVTRVPAQPQLSIPLLKKNKKTQDVMKDCRREIENTTDIKYNKCNLSCYLNLLSIGEAQCIHPTHHQNHRFVDKVQ